jgi:uncharacterized protein YfcZ (UPF0381/DUF406 family)
MSQYLPTVTAEDVYIPDARPKGDGGRLRKLYKTSRLLIAFLQHPGMAEGLNSEDFPGGQIAPTIESHLSLAKGMLNRTVRELAAIGIVEYTPKPGRGIQRIVIADAWRRPAEPEPDDGGVVDDAADSTDKNVGSVNGVTEVAAKSSVPEEAESNWSSANGAASNRLTMTQAGDDYVARGAEDIIAELALERDAAALPAEISNLLALLVAATKVHLLPRKVDRDKVQDRIGRLLEQYQAEKRRRVRAEEDRDRYKEKVKSLESELARAQRNISEMAAQRRLEISELTAEIRAELLGRELQEAPRSR